MRPAGARGASSFRSCAADAGDAPLASDGHVERTSRAGVPNGRGGLVRSRAGSTNVLRFKRIGRTNICQVNRSSVLYPMLRDLFDFERGALEDLYSRIADGLPRGDKALIFGSYARGEQAPDSDLDVLIIAKNKEKTQDALDDLVFSIIRSHSVVVSPVILSNRTPAAPRSTTAR